MTQTLTEPSVRLLVRGVNWLGDAVMSTAALLQLRESRPDWQITLLSLESLADLWSHHSAIDRVLTFARDESLWSVARRLHAGSYDIGLALPNSIRSALELWLARIPTRIGYRSNALRGSFLTSPVALRSGAVLMRKKSPREVRQLIQAPPRPAAVIPAAAHHVFHYLQLTAHLGADSEPLRPRIDVTPDEERAFRSRWQLEPGTPLLGINPGAEYGPAKRWPAERFIAAALETQKETGCRCLVFGGPADLDLAERITTAINSSLGWKAPSGPSTSAAPAINLAGQTTLRELCIALKICRAVLTNDTGPMHVAAAVGTPVIVPFGSTSPELTGPGLPGSTGHVILRSGAACSPCFLRTCPIDFRCMQEIDVSQASRAALRAFRDSNER